jgi:hypothetical protein
MKFDLAAVATPYPFVGAVARFHGGLLAGTVDSMVADPRNVTDEEGLAVWGIPVAQMAKLQSRSATDVSELAYKVHRGSVTTMKRALKDTADAYLEWTRMAERADAEGVGTLIAAVEAEHAAREIRRTALSTALFFEGVKQDETGTVRHACALRVSGMAHEASKVYVDTGNGGTAEQVAADVASKPPPAAKRPRSEATNDDRRVTCLALLSSALLKHGLEPDNGDEEEAALVNNAPTSLRAMITAVNRHTAARAAAAAE